jgi:hypothetical protein
MKNSRFFLLCLLAVGVVLRLLAARGDLWLDEAMSLLAVRKWEPNNPLLVFGWAHDNNHPLNSLWMYLTRGVSSAWPYRILSLLSGIGSLILVSTWPLKRAGIERMVLAVLWTFSYLLCLYDSEARGYAPMVFFGLLAWRFSLRLENSITWFSVLKVNLCLLLSSLAHVIGVYWFVFVGVLLLGGQGRTRPKAATRILLLLPSFLFLGLYYWGFIETLPEGSGALRSYTEVILSALALAGGASGLSAFAPREGLLSLLVVALFCALSVKALAVLSRSEKKLASALLTGIIAAPILVLVVFEPRVLYERYLLVPIALSYFLLASYFSYLWEYSKGARVFVALLLVAYVGGNSFKLYELLAFGRGSYSAAFHEMTRENSSGVTTAAFDQPFRGEVIAELYGESRGIRATTEVAKSEWYVLSSQERGFEPPQEIDFKEAGRFVLTKTHRSAQLSGFTWFVYQRVEPPAQ